MSQELREQEARSTSDGLPPETVDARDLRGAEQDLAGGRTTAMPFALLTWVWLAIAAVVALVVAVAALAYALA